MKYTIKLQKGNLIQKSDNTKIHIKQSFSSIPLNQEQIQNYKMYGELNRPLQKETILSQGKKKTVEEQKQSDYKLASKENLENYQKQKQKESQDLQHAAEVIPYVIPGIGQAMWAGKAVDLATNKVSKGKYKSWGNVVDQNVGGSNSKIDKFAADLTNPGYYAMALPKLVGKGITRLSNIPKIKVELGRDKIIPELGHVKNFNVYLNGKQILNQDLQNSLNIVDKGNEIVVGNIFLPEELRGKGLTKKIYQELANFNKKPLVNSSKYGFNQSEAGARIWKNKESFIPNTSFKTYLLNKAGHYLMGDKKIPMMSMYKPKSNFIDNVNDKFVSEINWSNWNKEIPKNTQLMKEYNAIEQTSKANGTWMKNQNGSIFNGTPEQFIQQNSDNFKKAFPNGSGLTYRGDRTHYPELDYNPVFTGDKQMALNYTQDNASYWTPNHPFKAKSKSSDPTSGGLHELYYNPNRIKIKIDAKNKDYTRLKLDEIAGDDYISTDDIARRIASGSRDAEINNVYDASVYPGTVRIINHNYGSNNFMKSARGNNGMFDMTNPNIYKGLIPAAGLYGLTQSKKQGGILKAQEGGLIYPKVNQLINRTNQKNIDFVNRLKDPKRKFLTNWENPNQIITHKMSWATDDKGATIYPNVQNIKGKLVDFTRPPYNKWAGYNSAIQRGDTIQTTPEVAQEYTTTYKKFYPTFDK